MVLKTVPSTEESFMLKRKMTVTCYLGVLLIMDACTPCKPQRLAPDNQKQHFAK